MIQFITGIAMLLIAYKLWQRVYDRREVHQVANDTEKRKLLKMQQEALEAQIKALRLQQKQAEQSESKAESDELTAFVVRDALLRENRAKAALQAILRVNGCNEEQIQEIIDNVDRDAE